MKPYFKSITKIALVVLSIFTSNIAYSQSSIHVKAGLNYTYLVQDKPENKEYWYGYENVTPGFGYAFGISKELPFWKVLAFQPGILFTKKSFFTNSNDNIRHDNFSIGYLEFPLNLVFYKKINKLKFFALAGPFVSIALYKHETIVYPDYQTGMQIIQYKNGYDEVNFVNGDFGINTGLGVVFDRYKFELGFQIGRICCIEPVKKLRSFSLLMEYKIWQKKKEKVIINDIND